MACWPRELRELALLVRSTEPDSTNLGEYLAAHAEQLAPFLNATPANLRSTAALRDEDVATGLRHRLERISRSVEDDRRTRSVDRAARAAATLGATARWTEYGAVLDVELLLRDVLADRTKKYIVFESTGVDVAASRKTLVQVASLRRLHIDLVAFVDADGLYFRWKGGRGGYNWRPQVVHPADADRVLTVPLRPAHPTSVPARRGAWLGEILREWASPRSRSRPSPRRRAVLHLEFVATIVRPRRPRPPFMLEIQDQEHFEAVVAHAKAIGLYDGEDNSSLRSRLDYLAAYGGKTDDGSDKTRVRLFKDFAPYSFGFVIEAKNEQGEWTTWFNGGLLFHGAHDGNGSGSAPTLAVTLTPVTGWSIHT